MIEPSVGDGEDLDILMCPPCGDKPFGYEWPKPKKVAKQKAKPQNIENTMGLHLLNAFNALSDNSASADIRAHDDTNSTYGFCAGNSYDVCADNSYDFCINNNDTQDCDKKQADYQYSLSDMAREDLDVVLKVFEAESLDELLAVTGTNTKMI